MHGEQAPQADASHVVPARSSTLHSVTPVPILLTRLSGVHRDQQMARDAIDAPPLRRARERLPWLLIGLAGSALVTVTMAGFDATLASSVAVAFFVPGIVYLADAIGTQTEAAAVRGLSLVHEPLPHLVWGELRTGLLMGITLASIALPAVWLAFGELPLALPVAGALLGPRVGWPPPSAYCSRGCCGERGAVGRIATGLGASTAALHGETTMTVQALDLGLVVPLSVMSAIFAVRRHPLGLAAAAAFVVMFVTMCAAIASMMVSGWIVTGVLQVPPIGVLGIASSASSAFPAAFRAMWLPRPPAPSMRAASSAMRSPMRTAPRSTTRTSSSPA